MTPRKDKMELIRATYYPLLFIALLWLIKGIETAFGLDFSEYGIYPLNGKGLRGIVLSPLIHANWGHLTNNSVPLLVLGSMLFYFYRPIAARVFFLSYFIHGFWLWFFARSSYHIGASGLIYALGAFLFTSGVLCRNTKMLAIALVVAFEYGSMVWGIFPNDEHISWEGHLTGTVAGIVLAVYLHPHGPKRNIGNWKNDMPDEPDVPPEEAYWDTVDELDDYERKLVE